jgi:DNA-binding transcriptional regulator YhcF (GntR family)
MEFSVDRDLPVPLRAQLQGLIEYGIACGELAPGEMLPSVRDLAERAGVAPMTVSQVYGDLKKAGLIETRPGAGSFVSGRGRERLASRPEAAELHRRIDALIGAAAGAGVRPSELVAMVSARAFYRDSIGPRTRVVMAGLFPEATASYARVIAARLGASVTVEPVTVSALEREPQTRARANSADLVVTFVNRQREVAALVPNAKVVSISFIPAEETRRSLAALDPLARVAVVSRFPDFLPIMKAGVQRFAPHVAQVSGATLGTPDLGRLLSQADVAVFASGAEEVAGRLKAGAAAIEYRHAPDAGEIERVLVPLLKAADGGEAGEERRAS